MTRKGGLPRRVYLKHGRYYFVTLEGQWVALTREREGLPLLYRALAALQDGEVRGDYMPAVIARWSTERESEEAWAPSTKRNMDRVTRHLAARFGNHRPADITALVVREYLKPLRGTARTHNLHRSVLRQVLAYAAAEGLRDGHNPCDDVPQRKTPGRSRIVTDAEVKAIKAALMTASRGGQAHCLMIDLCMLTGQRISDVLKMRWQDVTDDGLLVDQGKTGTRMMIEWSAPLKAAVDACADGRDRIGHLLVQSTGQPYRYAGVRSAWVRALAKAGITDLNIHDLRGRAGADVADEAGPYAAQKLLGHDSIRTTEHYIAGKTRRRAQAPGGPGKVSK
ncbi:MAG: hypothetical protein RL375_1736 [Pseudomonadota bacterium]